MDAKHAVSHLRNRGTYYGDSVYNEIADLIETLVRERDEARQRMLTDEEHGVIDRAANRLWEHKGDGGCSVLSHSLRAIVARFRPPKIEWTRTGTTSVAVIGGVTYTVLKSSRGWWWMCDGQAMNGHDRDIREDAESAAEKHAMENHHAN